MFERILKVSTQLSLLQCDNHGNVNYLHSYYWQAYDSCWLEHDAPEPIVENASTISDHLDVITVNMLHVN